MYIRAKVRAGAKKELITALSDTQFLIAVKQKPEQNMANKRVVEILAEHFGVPAKSIRILSGHHSPHKIFSIR